MNTCSTLEGIQLQQKFFWQNLLGMIGLQTSREIRKQQIELQCLHFDSSSTKEMSWNDRNDEYIIKLKDKAYLEFIDESGLSRN